MCNLKCEYCKLDQYQSPDVAVEEMVPILEHIARKGNKIVHFTGGEAKLRPALERLVEKAHELGMVSSMSTNGTGDPELFRRLVSKGLKYIYVSLDAASADTANKMAGRDVFDQAVRNIGDLVDLRKNGSDVYITVNACVNETNFYKMHEAAPFIMGLGIDDFKFIPVTGFVPPDDKEYMQKVSSMVPKDQYPFFHYRFGNFYSPRGLDKDCSDRCFIPLDEMTATGRGFYPCTIYFREGGPQIACRQTTIPELEASVLAWVADHDTLADPVCRANCCDITRDYNKAVQYVIKHMH
jgi:MoaA/NifB/PqqE/SkfB family radical SAM enzyme